MERIEVCFRKKGDKSATPNNKVADITAGLKPVKGQKLGQWLQRFLVADPKQLDSWRGTFTEVITAKVVAILRKRGSIEELEEQKNSFSRLMNCAYQCDVFQPVAEQGKGENSPQNP